MKVISLPDPIPGRNPKTLDDAKRIGHRLAYADCMGTSESPFAAVAWRETLPLAWQNAVEAEIVDVYHNT